MYKKNIFHRIQNKFIDLKIGAEKELKILTSLKSNKQTAAYAGWVGYDNLGDEVLYESYIKLFHSFCFIPYKSNSIVERYYKLIKKQVYDVGVLGGGTLINQNFRWLKEVKELQRKKIPLFCFGTGVAQEDFWRQQHDEYWKNNISEWVKILSSFLFVGVRGPISKKILLDNGLKNVVVVGDTALSLAPNTFKRKKYNKVIGINFGVAKGNPMWGHPDKFIRQMTLLIKYLLLKNYKIILLPVWKVMEAQ